LCDQELIGMRRCPECRARARRCRFNELPPSRQIGGRSLCGRRRAISRADMHAARFERTEASNPLTPRPCICSSALPATSYQLPAIFPPGHDQLADHLPAPVVGGEIAVHRKASGLVRSEIRTRSACPPRRASRCGILSMVKLCGMSSVETGDAHEIVLSNLEARG
jgi:hypothetical protein